MKARLFDSVEQMLSPEGLAAVMGTPVERVERAPLDVEHYSGNSLERVSAISEGRETRFVLKHFSIESDWIMRHTHDSEVREVALFRGGVYQRVPDLCIIPIVAAAREGKSWASLMVDVSEHMLPGGHEPLSIADLRRILDHLAVVHARFMEDESLLNPALGLSSLRDFILILSKPVVSRELEQGRTHPVLEAAARGWDIFDEVGMPEAVRIIRKTQLDLRPLLRALARAPRTLVHGDYKIANLGKWSPSPATTPASRTAPAGDSVAPPATTPASRTAPAGDSDTHPATAPTSRTAPAGGSDAPATAPASRTGAAGNGDAPVTAGAPGDGVGTSTMSEPLVVVKPPEPRTIIIDWQDATFGSPLLDIAYFLAINCSRLPVSKEEAIQMYRDSLASFGYSYQPAAWARDLEVGLLAGGGMRLVWQKALGTQSDDPVVRAREMEEVRWWCEQIIRGSRWLSS